MKKIIFGSLSFLLILFVVLAWTASAEVPGRMTYQGSLTDSSGTTLTGSYDFRFTIKDGSDSTLWGPETHTTISATKGVYSVILGTGTSIAPSVFDTQPAFINVEVRTAGVGGYELLSPSSEVVTVGNAFQAVDLSGGPSKIRGITYWWPASTPTAGKYLKTQDGLGTLTWETVTSGTVTSVGTGTGLTGGPITSTGTIALSTPVSVANGGTNATSFTASQLVRMNSGGTTLESSGKVAPTGAIVGTTDTQTLTNKTLDGTNTISAEAIKTGTLALARGGTNADLSATGGANQYVKQATLGGAFTVGTIASSELPTHVHATGDITSGTLVVARGGTNATATPTAGAVAYGTGTAYAFTAVGSSGQVLRSNAGSAPTWTTPTSGTVTSVGLTMPSGLSVANSPITGSGTIAVTTVLNGPIRGNGSGFITGNISLTTEVSGTLPVGSGGTGATTLLGMLKGNATSPFTPITSTAGYVTYWIDARTIYGEPYLDVLRGGTGIGTTPTNGQLLIGNGTNYNLAALSGDMTVTATGVTTLAATTVGPGSYGSATLEGTFTVDQKGRITAASNVPISGVAPGGAAGGHLAGTYPNPVIATGVVTSGAIANNTITAADMGTGSVTADALASTTVGPGSYGSATLEGTFTVDQDGRLTAASNVAISGLLPSGTSGQTLRSNGTSWLANSVLYNNGTNVGIGTTGPGSRLDLGILAPGANTASPFLRWYGGNANWPGELATIYDATYVDQYLLFGAQLSGTKAAPTHTVSQTLVKGLWYDAANADLNIVRGTSNTAGTSFEVMVTFDTSGNVGIGTAAPYGGLLNVVKSSTYNNEGTGGIAIDTGVSGQSKLILGADASNNISYIQSLARLTSYTTKPLSLQPNGGNVGIGTTSPGASLEVAGQVKITGGSPGAGKVLTSNAVGLADWQTSAGGTVTSVTGTSPITSSGGTTPAIGITQTSITNLNSALTTGLLKITTGTGLLSTAVAGADYQAALTTGNMTATSPITVSATRQVIGGAVVLSHDTTAGNIHLPAAGTSNQILKNSGTAGTGAWGTVTENAGALAAVTTIGMSGQLTNTLATGTAPFSVASTTKVTNLNADQVDGYTVNNAATGIATYDASTRVLDSDKLDGQHGSYYQAAGTSVTSVTGNSPITSSGGLTPAIGITQTSITNLNSTLGTGLLKITTGTGLLSTAVAGTDYQTAGNYITALTGEVTAAGPGSAAATIASQTSDTWRGKVSDETGTGQWVFGRAPTFTTSISTPALANLTSNGFVKTSGGTGTLTVDATSYQPALTTGNMTATSPITVSATRQVIGGAVVITHDTTAGNIHLPAAGVTNQILKNSGTAGTGAWGTVTETAGALGAVTTIGMSGQLTNTLAIGTKPFVITSTTLNNNLNADLLDGNHASAFMTTEADTLQTVTNRGSSTTNSITVTGNANVFQNAANSVTSFQIKNAAGTSVLDVDTTNQRVGIGTAAPTAALHLKAGTAAASTAPLKFEVGTLLTAPEDGAIEYDGSQFYSTAGGPQRCMFARILSSSASLDFPSTLAQRSSDLTIAVTGAQAGDMVTLGSSGAVPANSCFTAWAATNIVTVRFNNYSSGTLDPSAITFTVAVIKSSVE